MWVPTIFIADILWYFQSLISLLINLSGYVNFTLFLPDANLEWFSLSLSNIIFRVFPLNLLLFLLLLLSAVFFATFCLMPFSRPQCCSQMLAPTAALLCRLFSPCWTSSLCLHYSMLSVTSRRIATDLHRPYFVLNFRCSLLWSIQTFRPFTHWMSVMSSNLSDSMKLKYFLAAPFGAQQVQLIFGFFLRKMLPTFDYEPG